MSQKQSHQPGKGGHHHHQKGGQQRGHQGEKFTNKESFYSSYLSEEELQSGIESQRFYVGVLRIITKQPKYGFVSVPSAFSQDIIIYDMKDRNRAYHGDTVVVDLYPTAEWPAPSNPMNDNLSIATTNHSDQMQMPSLDNLQINDPTQQLWRPREDLLIPFGQPAVEETKGSTPFARRDVPGLQPKGRVVGILKSSSSSHKGLIGSINLNGRDPSANLLDQGAFVTFIPADGRYPHLIVTKSHLPDEFLANPLAMSTSTIFLADISSDWPSDSKLAFGENVRAVGQVGDIAAETEALLIENGLNHSPYSGEVLEPLMEFLRSNHNLGSSSSSSDGNWCIPDEEFRKRRDYRDCRRIFTIDPPNARDLDDALHITPLTERSSSGQALYEVGVHIADVSHFVPPDTPLDLEARYRATSVYLVQKVIPMLPRILCEQLCSLNPNVDRLAFSVVFVLTEDGDLSEGHVPWFGRTVIRSCAKLDYGTAQRIVDGEIPLSNEDVMTEELWETSRRPVLQAASENGSRVSLSCKDVANDVCLLHKVAMSRRKKRLQNGALVLSRPKMIFQLDSDGNPVSTRPYPIKESNQLIEEYMLLGNYLVAEKLLETVGPLAFLRHHPPPDTQGLDLLVHFASTLGCDLDITSSSSLQRSLSTLQSNASSGRSADLILQVITSLLMKPMNRAKYLIAGDNRSSAKKQSAPLASASSPTLLSRWRHYALSIPYYTHFTSPIRRYADVMVHRLLEEGLQREREGGGYASRQREPSEDDESSGRSRLEDLIEIADHCNTQKEASKAAQDRSDVVFLSVYLMKSPQRSEGIVVGMAEKSFTVLILPFSLEARIFIDKIGVADSKQREGGSVTGRYNEENKTLMLVNSQPGASVKGQAVSFSSMELCMMSRVAVYLSANTSPPISVRVDFLGPVS
jgi:DIS3-like exonuclease 2